MTSEASHMFLTTYGNAWACDPRLSNPWRRVAAELPLPADIREIVSRYCIIKLYMKSGWAWWDVSRAMYYARIGDAVSYIKCVPEVTPELMPDEDLRLRRAALIYGSPVLLRYIWGTCNVKLPLHSSMQALHLCMNPDRLHGMTIAEQQSVPKLVKYMLIFGIPADRIMVPNDVRYIPRHPEAFARYTGDAHMCGSKYMHPEVALAMANQQLNGCESSTWTRICFKYGYVDAIATRLEYVDERDALLAQCIGRGLFALVEPHCGPMAFHSHSALAKVPREKLLRFPALFFKYCTLVLHADKVTPEFLEEVCKYWKKYTSIATHWIVREQFRLARSYLKADESDNGRMNIHRFVAKHFSPEALGYFKYYCRNIETYGEYDRVAIPKVGDAEWPEFLKQFDEYICL